MSDLNSNTHLKIALVGNPNAGKSTLFNGLTGLNQKTGNYSGVTVDRYEGKFHFKDNQTTYTFSVLDSNIPGKIKLRFETKIRQQFFSERVVNRCGQTCG